MRNNVKENVKSLKSKKIKVNSVKNKIKSRITKKVEKESKQLNIDNLKTATDAVKSGMSFREAAEEYEVSRTSLFRVVKDPEKVKTIFTPPTILSATEEEEIVNWLLVRARSGCPATKSELLDCVQAYTLKLKKQTPFTNGKPGRHWFEAFSKRHPNLTSRTAQHLILNRAMVTEEDLRGWFVETHAYLEKKQLVNIDASRVFNCDETNIQLLPKSEKIISSKGARSAYKIVDACEKESLTALFMYSAAEVRTPPMVMYKCKESVPKKYWRNSQVVGVLVFLRMVG